MFSTTLDTRTIAPNDLAYPVVLKTCAAFRAAPTLSAIGNLDLLSQNAIALFCSIECPGDLILKTYDLAQALRDASIPIISGFHSPIEQDWLKILLCGAQPTIYCPARNLHKIRLSPAQKQAVKSDRLLLISPFSASYPRATTELAAKRNEMIGAIVHTIFIAYAAPNSKTLAFAQRLIESGKSVITLDSPDNSVLQVQGIIRLDAEAIMPQVLKLYASRKSQT